MKLLGVLDKLQREKVLNQEMIKGVQKGMGTMKETYTKDLEHWKEERNVLEKHIKEVINIQILTKINAHAFANFQTSGKYSVCDT